MGWPTPRQLLNHWLEPRQRRAVAAAGVALLAVLAGLLWQQLRSSAERERQRQSALEAPITTVTALGRLQPEGTVLKLAPPAGSLGLPQGRIRTLLVEEGDHVRQGQLLATMDSLPRLSRAVDEAAAKLAIAETRLQVASASQRNELLSQRARVERAQAKYRTEVAETKRYQDLFRLGATSASLAESHALSMETARAELAEARSRLQRLQIRVPTAAGTISLDEAAAQRELVAARSQWLRIQTERDDALIRAPISGRVLSIHARAGEIPAAEGILELGRTDRMELVAEVYQSDRQRLRLGQAVQITSTALARPLLGRVNRIGAIVRRQSLINTDPSANTDTRVIEVHAQLDAANSRRAADLSNLQVTAVFQR